MWRRAVAALILAVGCAGGRHEKREDYEHASPPRPTAQHAGKSSGRDEAGNAIGEILGSIFGVFFGGGDDPCGP